MKNCLFFFAACTLFFACSSDKPGDDKENIAGADTMMLSDSAHLFVLSAPLQVSTFLRTHAQNAHPEFLSDKSHPASDYTTDYQRALNLGVCITDAGYAALYGDRQLALDYIARIEELVKGLRVEPAAAPYMERVRANLENPDSMSLLMLSIYNDVQENLNGGNREKAAFYVVSGCYLENLSITVQHEKLQGNPAFVQLLAQEKLWLENITEALTYLEPDEESQDLYNTFYTLQDCFKDFVIGTDPAGRPMCKFTTEAYTKLMQKSVQMRDEVTGTKAA